MITNIAFFIWILLACAIVGFFLWTLYTLHQQKTAWRAFAKAKNLRYANSPNFMDSPQVIGTLEGYALSIFGSEHMREGMRTPRKMTTLEISLRTKASPITGAIASGGMTPFVQDETMDFGAVVVPSSPVWDAAWLARAQDSAALLSYLTPQRVQALATLMRIPQMWVIFIFKGEEMLLRLDTPDPLDEPARLEGLVARLIATAKILEP